MLPSGQLPTFNPPPKEFQGRFAVKIFFDSEYRDKFPIRAQGAAAIYTGGGGFGGAAADRDPHVHLAQLAVFDSVLADC